MGENNNRASWNKMDNVVEKIWKDLGGVKEEVLFTEEFSGYKTEVKEIIEESERLALKVKVKEEKHLDIYGEVRGDIGMKAYLHGPMDYAKKLKLRFRVGDLDLPEIRDIPVVGGRRTWLQICACVGQQ